jgi:hypothetical protein
MKILVEGASKRSIHRDYGIGHQALGPRLATIEQILADDKEAPPKRRHTTRRIFERLRADRAEFGYTGCYSQVQTAVKNAGGYVQLGVLYLAWTGIYLIFKLIMITFSWHEVRSFLNRDLLTGYSQLYAAIVIFQYYLLLPFLLRLLRSTRRHSVIMAASLAFAIILGLVLHYPSWFPALSDVCTSISSGLPWSRDLLTYQEFFVAGTLVAFHFDQVCEFVSGHYRQIFVFSGVVGALMVLWYAIQVDTGTSVLRASDPYQSPAVIWYFAAIAAVFALCQWWQAKMHGSSSTISSRRLGLSADLAALTGGIWLSHNLFISSLRAVLGGIGLRATLPWEATVTIVFVGTVLISVAFTSLVLRTRLRWVLGGPVRSEQRAGYSRRALGGWCLSRTAP